MCASFHPFLALSLAAVAFFFVMRTKLSNKQMLGYLAFVGVFFLVALTPGRDALGEGFEPEKYVLTSVAAATGHGPCPAMRYPTDPAIARGASFSLA